MSMGYSHTRQVEEMRRALDRLDYNIEITKINLTEAVKAYEGLKTSIEPLIKPGRMRRAWDKFKGYMTRLKNSILRRG